MKAVSILLLLALTSCAVFELPVVWIPLVHEDGSKTWSIDQRATKYDPTGPDKIQKLAANYMAFYKFCDKWEITSQHEAKGHIYIEGRCI